MAIDVLNLALSKQYTDEEVAGGGAIKGKNCVIDEITEITGGHKVKFKWTLDNGTVLTGSMDVMDGTDGTDGATGATGPQGPKGDKGDKGDTGAKGKDGANVVTVTQIQSTGTKLAEITVDGQATDIYAPNNYAELENGKVLASQLPSFVDDVIDGYYKEADGKFYEESTYETEIPGETGKIYISVDTSIQYRWTGSAFSALGGALVLGETSSTAYRGDRGKIAYDDSQTNKTHIGNLALLETTAKSDLVSAINEAAQTGGSGGGTAAYVIGEIISFMGATPPSGYLACDGSVYNISAYSKLANFIEDQFGTKNHFGGDGVTTFAVPDLRGEFLRGTGTNGHSNSGDGANVGVHQRSSNIRGGWIPKSDQTHPFIRLDSSETGDYVDFIAYADKDYINHSTGAHTVLTFSAQKSTEASNDEPYAYAIRPTNTSVLYCICYTDVAPTADTHDYSTTEQVVGTWIDGKPVYERTIAVTSPNTTAETNVSIAELGFTNIDKIFMASPSYIYLYINNKNQYVPITLGWGANGAIGIIPATDASHNGYLVWNVAVNEWISKDGYVTLRYTKTTD